MKQLLGNKRKSFFTDNIKEDKKIFLAKIKNVDIISRNKIKNLEKEEKIKGNDIIFKHRKLKALELMKKFKDEQIIEIDELKQNISQCLEYNNTNPSIICDCLFLLNNKHYPNNQIEISNMIKNYRFCLTNHLEYNKKLLILKNEFNINDNNIFLFETEDDIIKQFFSCLNYLDEANQELIKLDEKEFNKNFKKNLLTYNLRKIDEDFYIIINKRKTKNDIINNINCKLYKFLKYYLCIKEFDYFENNQPIKLNDNPILFMYNILYYFYEKTVEVKSKTKITINISKLKKISEIKMYWENIKNLYLKEKSLTNEIGDKLEFFLFLLEAPNDNNDLQDIIKTIMIKERPLTLNEVKEFMKNNKKENKDIFLEKDYICVNFKDKIYRYEFKNYTNVLLEYLKIDNEGVLENAQFNPVVLIDFFYTNDKLYLKNLIRTILKSKLFREVWEKYGEADKIFDDYYFDNEENIEEFIENIHFLPFYERDFGLQAITKNNLLIYTSSLPISSIKTKNDFINYKILELARKVIIIMHELYHYIKKALFMISNGKISRTAKDYINQTDDIEAGRIFEELLFNWANPDNKEAKKNKKEKNNNYSKIIDLGKSLKILNPDFYEQNIDEFKKNFYNDNIDPNNLNLALKEYIKSLGFDLEKYLSNKNSFLEFTIDCARIGDYSYSILYKSDNHSIFNNRQLITFRTRRKRRY